MLKSQTGRIVLVTLLTACSGDRELDLSTSGDDEADIRARRMAVTVTVSGLESTWGVRKLTRDYILEDCLTSLKSTPGGSLFNTSSPSSNGCYYASDMVTSENDPLVP